MTLKADRRLPPGWVRLLQYLRLVIVGAIVWVALLLLVFGRPVTALAHSETLPQLAIALYGVGLYAMLLGGAAYLWRKDGGVFAVRFSPANLAEGWILGLVGLGLLVAIERGAGWITPRAGAHIDPLGLFTAAIVGMLFAVSEEVLFRGFVLGLLRRDLAPFGALAASATIFALAHYLHPFDWRTVLLPLAGLWSAGALLASCRLRTGSLWLGIGLHASWVWYITASGQQRWWSIHDSLWTGGGSPAAGLLGPLLLGLTYMWVRRRHRAIVP